MVITLLLSGSAYAAEHTLTIGELRQLIQATDQQIVGLNQRMQQIKDQLFQQSQSITTLKSRHSESENPFLHYRLQGALKSAQTLANQLQQLELQKNNLQLQSQQSRQALMVSINQQLELITARLAASNVTPKEKRLLSVELARLVQEGAQLSDAQKKSNDLEVVLQNPKDYLPDQNDGLEDLANKAALLHDIKDKIKIQLREINTRLASLQRQQLVFKEARHLMDEEAFFAEMSFAKNNGDINQQTINNNSAKVDAKLQSENDTPQTTGAPVDVEGGTAEPLASTNINGDVGVPINASVNAEPVTGSNPVPETLNAAESFVKPTNLNDATITRRVEINQIFSKRNNENRSLHQQLSNLRQSETTLQEHIQKIDEHLNIVLSMMRIIENAAVPKK